MSTINAHLHKMKAVFVMGATGTGKSRLSIDLATRFPAEIINSDKMQVYKGLDIVTNKVSEVDRQGVPHHLIGEVDPNSDFNATDFCIRARTVMQKSIKSGRVPIVVGGSNSFLQALVEDPNFKFECCFLWMHVSLPVLFSFVSKRVDKMVFEGLVEEVRGIYDPDADYTKGIRRSIGVPEMDKYFRHMAETETSNDELLRCAIEEIKENTRKLICDQLRKIHHLRDDLGWPIHQIDATIVFQKYEEEADKAWEDKVLQPSMKIVSEFLKEDGGMFGAQLTLNDDEEEPIHQARF